MCATWALLNEARTEDKFPLVKHPKLLISPHQVVRAVYKLYRNKQTTGCEIFSLKTSTKKWIGWSVPSFSPPDSSITTDSTIMTPVWALQESWLASRQGTVIQSPHSSGNWSMGLSLPKIHQISSISPHPSSAQLFTETLIILHLDHCNTYWSHAAEILVWNENHPQVFQALYVLLLSPWNSRILD